MSKLKTFTYKNIIKAQKVIETPEWCLPHNLSLLIKKHEISMSKVALYSGISKAYLSQLISGNHKSPSIGTVMNLATFWEMSCEDLCFKKIK